MLATAINRSADDGDAMRSDLVEKFRLLMNRRSRLRRLVGMHAPEIVVRNEQRMLKAALDDLLGDADVEDIDSFVGDGIFAHHLNYIAGTAIDASSGAHALTP